MKSHHTFTITIPTRAILYVGAGLLAGLAIGAVVAVLVALGIDLWVPVAMLPALGTVKAVQAPQAVAEAHDPVLAALGDHPAAHAFRAVPLPVRIELNAMVDRVLAEKWAEAA